MVLYYGRALQRVGSVNTNQLGLKMSGCPSKVGKSGRVSRALFRRSHCGIGQCGVIYVHGVPWKPWVLRRRGRDRCLVAAPRTRAQAGGVYRGRSPRLPGGV